jgi:hypothetical protein
MPGPRRYGSVSGARAGLRNAPAQRRIATSRSRFRRKRRAQSRRPPLGRRVSSLTVRRPCSRPVRYDERHPTPVRRSLGVRRFPFASPRPFIGPVAELANEARRSLCGVAVSPIGQCRTKCSPGDAGRLTATTGRKFRERSSTTCMATARRDRHCAVHYDSNAAMRALARP